MDAAPPRAPLSMGPFDLVRPVGRGAMGEVWRATHRTQKVDVAIKLLYGATARDPWAVEAFRNEVRAAAGLAHPGIVMVLDHGLVPPGSAVDQHSDFSAGTPYLVMELIHGRPMNRFIGRLRWLQVRDVLLQLLDALAHSHARGVVHRDIKPGNVLLRHPGGRVPDPQRPEGPLDALLTDFGLAQALDRHSSADAVVAGTPAYMAPEQLQGRWRDHGPSTDLYSVGCLGWSMVTGEPPFGKDRPFEEALHAHLHDDPPALNPIIPVPPAFELWLRRMLAKDRRDRYPRAADAAWALARLSASSERTGGGLRAPSGAPREGSEGPLPRLTALDLKTMPAAALRPALAGLTVPAEPAAGPEGEEDEPTERAALPARPTVVIRKGSAEAAQEDLRTPFPEAWRGPRPAPRPRQLLGLGLNLYGLRPPPMVGRAQERTRLWDALREVREQGQGRVVVLRGPAGCGRSRLGEWLCERADEVGAARVLSASHSADPAAPGGLGPMVARFLRCDGLEGEELDQRLHELIVEDDPLQDDLEGLRALLSARTARDGFEASGSPRAHYARGRYALVRRLIEREASEEHDRWSAVVVLWIDDVHLGRDALGFCRFLLDQMVADPLPVLMVLSAQDEALAERREEAEALAAIQAHAGATTLEIGPLPEAEHAELVRELLGMESDLVEQVATRTAGNPQFAVQLVGEWVQRGLLDAGPRGFRLRDGAAVELPPDIQRVWRARVEALVDGLPPPQAQALELAAVLGLDVDGAEWRSAAAIAGLEADPALVDRLLALRLAAPRGADGLRFSHAMLREALVGRAREGGRVAGHHRAAAAALERRSDDRRGLAERLGRHLLQAGQVLPAVGKLLEGAEERQREGDPTAARRLLDYRDRALRALQLPETDELWGLGWLARVEVDLLQATSAPVEAAALLRKVEELVAAQGWPRVAPRAALLRGLVHLRAGRYADAQMLFTRARQLAEARGDARLSARCAREEATCLLRTGARAAAREVLLPTLSTWEALGDRHGLAGARWNLGRIALQEQHLVEAEALIGAARADFEALGARWSLGECVNGLGDLRRLQGRLGDAEEHYRHALQHMEASGHHAALIPRINLGVVLVERRDFVNARQLIEPALRGLDRAADPITAAAMSLVLLAPVAHAGEWRAWDEHLAEISAVLSRTGFVDADNAHLAQLAADEALRQGATGAARAALGIAWQQLQALGRDAEVAALEARVATLAP